MPGAPAAARRDRVILVGLGLFAVGVVAVVVTVIGFAVGDGNRPLVQNLLAMLAPVGFVVAVVGAVRRGRADARRNAALYPAVPLEPNGRAPRVRPGRWEQALRIVALIEAVSWLLLIAATVVKYAAERPLAVQILGPVHGGLFIAYLVLVVPVWARRRWSVPTVALVVLESVLPGGGLLVYRRRDLQSER